MEQLTQMLHSGIIPAKFQLKQLEHGGEQQQEDNEEEEEEDHANQMQQ